VNFFALVTSLFVDSCYSDVSSYVP